MLYFILQNQYHCMINTYAVSKQLLERSFYKNISVNIKLYFNNSRGISGRRRKIMSRRGVSKKKDENY